MFFQCSVTCGEGKRNRFVRCEDAQGYLRSPTLCGHLDRPVSTQACSERPCGYWRSGLWGQVLSLIELLCQRSEIKQNQIGTTL